jgi:NADPH2 dehydrogenase
MAKPDLADKEGFDVVGPSAIVVDGGAHRKPRELREEEIWAFVSEFAVAARNAMAAGFDGVEVHSAYGTLVDQFTQDTSNQRTDSWGGSIEKRSQFAIEVVKAIAKEVGIENVGIRFSPFGTYLSMGMKDTVAQHEHLIKQLAQMGLQHLHLVEPRVDGIFDVENSHSNAPLIEAWTQATDAPLILAGGYTPGDAARTVEETHKGKNVAIGFGRPFTSNPDLPFKIKKGLPFTPYRRDAFYDVKNPKGYADWPFSDEFVAEYGVTQV